MAQETGLEQFVGKDVWVLVSYIPHDGNNDRAWVSIREEKDGLYIVNEMDSFYIDGDISNPPFYFKGSTSSKRHIYCDDKKRAKEEMVLCEPIKTLTSYELFSTRND